ISGASEFVLLFGHPMPDIYEVRSAHGCGQPKHNIERRVVQPGRPEASQVLGNAEPIDCPTARTKPDASRSPKTPAIPRPALRLGSKETACYTTRSDLNY